MSSDKSLFPSISDPIGFFLKNKNLPKGVHHLVRLSISLQEKFADNEVLPSSELKKEMDWLKSALSKMIDDEVAPFKALELETGRGRKKLSKELESKNFDLVERIESIRNEQSLSQNEAIAQEAGGDGRYDSVRGVYFRTLPSYAREQERLKELDSFLGFLNDPENQKLIDETFETIRNKKE